MTLRNGNKHALYAKMMLAHEMLMIKYEKDLVEYNFPSQYNCKLDTVIKDYQSSLGFYLRGCITKPRNFLNLGLLLIKLIL